jgi:hypothetical protein
MDVDFTDAKLEKAEHGDQDVTNDRRNVRFDIASQIVVCSMNAANSFLARPPTASKRLLTRGL